MPQSNEVECPYCGAKNRPDIRNCWLCGTDMTAATEEQAQPRRRPHGDPVLELLEGATLPDKPWLMREQDFSGPSIWVVLYSLGVVWLGFLLQWPGLGIVLALILTPVLLRTLLAMGKEARRRLAFGLVTLGAACASGLIILFATICAPVGLFILGGYILWFIIGVVSIGISAAAYELYTLYRFRARGDRS